MANKLISEITSISALKGSDQVEVESDGKSYSATVGLIMPAGTVIQYAGTSAPDGYLLCDGSAVSRSTYEDLYNAIGTVWGNGDGSTTFNLPDLRGAFLRGAGDGTINGRTKSGGFVGDYTEDQMQRITGDFTSTNFVVQSSNGAFSSVESGSNTGGGSTNGSTVSFDSSDSPDARTSTNTDGETYPYHAAVKMCIKY